MSTRIGRLVIADRPGTYDVGTGTISLSGRIFAESLAHAEHLRQQVVRLAGLGSEPEIPVVIEDGFVGFVRVTSATADAPAGAMAGHWFDYAIECDVIDNTASPAVTSTLSSVLRSNAHGLVTADAAPILGLPAGAYQWSWVPNIAFNDPDQPVDEIRPTAPGPAGGGVRYRRIVTHAMGATLARWRCAPQDWYAGSCGVEVKREERWLPVVGPQSIGYPWRASNGLVEITLEPERPDGNGGRMRFRWWRDDQTGWSAPQSFELGRAGSDAYAAWDACEVASMAPHRVVVRAQGRRPGGGRSTLWLTLVRGSRTVQVTHDTDSLPGNWIAVVPAATTTDNTSHMRLSSPIDGLRWFVATSVDNNVTTSGRISPVSGFVTTWSFGIGAIFTTAAADSADVAMAVRSYFTSQAESVRVG